MTSSWRSRGIRWRSGSGLLAATGLRRGEVLGLRWRDVDFDLGRLADRQHDHRGRHGGGDGSAEDGAQPPQRVPRPAHARRAARAPPAPAAAARSPPGRRGTATHDWVVTDELGGFIRPQHDVVRVAHADQPARPPADPSARPAPHARHVRVEGRRASQGRVRTISDTRTSASRSTCTPTSCRRWPRTPPNRS